MVSIRGENGVRLTRSNDFEGERHVWYFLVGTLQSEMRSVYTTWLLVELRLRKFKEWGGGVYEVCGESKYRISWNRSRMQSFRIYKRVFMELIYANYFDGGGGVEVCHKLTSSVNKSM